MPYFVFLNLMTMTARLILSSKETYDKEYFTVSKHDALEAMIEFAKLHVEAALKEAGQKASMDEPIIRVFYINKDSILNAYPLTNIK